MPLNGRSVRAARLAARRLASSRARQWCAVEPGGRRRGRCHGSISECNNLKQIGASARKRTIIGRAATSAALRITSDAACRYARGGVARLAARIVNASRTLDAALTASAAARLRPARKRVDRARLCRPSLSVEVAGRGVVGRVLGVGRFRDREHRGRARQESSARPGAALPHAPVRSPAAPATRTCSRRRKIVVTERRIGHDGDAMLFAPRDHRVLDGALLQMVEHLVAGDLAGPATSSSSSRSSASKLLTPQERILPAAIRLLEGGDGLR